MIGEKIAVGENNLSEMEEHHERKKRKFSVVNGDTGLEPLSDTFKKKKLQKGGSDLKQNDPRFHKFVVKKNYTKVSANPNLLPKTPKIFKKMESKKMPRPPSESFLLNLVTASCFNSDVNARFTNIQINNHSQSSERKQCTSAALDVSGERDQGARKKEKKHDKGMNRRKGEFEDCSYVSERVKNKDDEGEISHVDTYNVLQKKALVFHMHHPSTFSFFGEIKVTLIAGEVEILGYTLHESSDRKSVDVYSPNFCSPLIVESKAPNKSKTEEEVRNLLKDTLSEDDIKTLLTKKKPEDTILLIEQIVSSFGIVINKYFGKPLFPKDLEDVSSVSETVKSLQSIFTFSPSRAAKQYRKSPEWDRIPLGQCTVLCGGKGVGKSTLLKYYMNKFVMQGEKVLCLDFDPGQPEFTIPGCVSAVVVGEPLLGPNFTHVIDPELFLYFGDIDVSQNPTKYLEYVNYVIEFCKKNEELLKMKWFVNTMGYCKGLGIELMITILKMLQPNTVIQIKSSDIKKNYPFFLTPTKLNSRRGFRMCVEDVPLFFDLHVIGSSAERNGKSLKGGLTPRHLRDIMSISYFSKLASPPFFNFNAVQPYLISFSRLFLGIDSSISPNDILKAFNGNTISLTHYEPGDDEIYEAQGGDDFFKIVFKPSITPCLGIGFVRGIDCNEKKFYVMTHLSSEDLNRVNCLTLGRISPPHCMFLKQDQIEGQAVYTSVSTVEVVQRVKRMFRVPEHLK